VTKDRRAIGEDFVAALRADFERGGRRALAKFRNDKPAEYLKVIAAILPRDVHAETDPKADAVQRLSDADLAEALATLRSLRRPRAKTPGRGRAAARA
jgi:hypothetical protein